jgi:D-beta-D-heptose 7-phosphate kinase / D-beta-D-heptose 1-phosphate adenosyltransferase
MNDRLELANWIERLNNARVLVLGDVMLDRFVYGDVSRISPEGPVPILRSADIKSTLGGSGNVLRNLISLGAKAYFISLVGDDAEGRQIKEIISGLGDSDTTLVIDPKRQTTVKTRFIASRQQLLRVDSEMVRPLEESSCRETLEAFCRYVELCDVVVFSDYGKGFLSPELLKSTIDICVQQRKPVLVDPKGIDYSIYRNASILTPNLKELGEATRMQVNGDDAVVAAAQTLIDSCELKAVIATRSQDGMSVVEASGSITHLKSEAKEVFDVTGAGDTVIATLAAAIGGGAPLQIAAEIANIAAGIVVGKLGTAVPYPADLIHAIRRQELSTAEAKILDIQAAIDRVEIWRHKGLKIGFINGFFEFLHPGHLRMLSQASKACDRLVAGIHADVSVARIKGEPPILNESARSAILASLEGIDMVVIFPEDTPMHLLDLLRPDVLIKGSGLEVESDFVSRYGGDVIVVQTEALSADSSLVLLANKSEM